MGFNLQLGDALRSESVTAIDDAIRAIARQEIDRTPRTKFCDACAYMHRPEISARCCCVACHGDDVPAWAQRMNVTTPLSSEKTGDASPASEVKACPFCGGRARLISHESPEVTNYGYEVNCDECAAQGPSTDCEWDGNAEYAKRDAIAAWNRRAPAPSPESEVVLDMPETDSGPLGRAQLEALHRLLAPVLDAAGFSPAHETAKKAIERLLAQWRSGLEPRVPPSPASFSLNPGASKTPGSQQASEELDELLRMHARHDNDDTEDCWTKPAVRAIQYLSDLRWDLQVTTNRAAILAETNESLRRMIADMAAYAGTTFGADEPVKNAEVVKKALAPSPASGEWARMTTREREEILKNDEIALAIADGMARCADVFCDQAQLDRRREAARMTHKRLADSRELLADLRAEAVAAWAAAEAAEERCSYKACGCMYDRKDDVCSVHSPIVSKVTAERDAARSELAALLAKSARRYAHMCRSEHVEIGFNDCVPDQPDELNCKECGGDSTRAPQPAREAQGEPTLEECETAYEEAWRNADIGSLSVDDIKNPGVAAVRALCLAGRAPSSGATWRVEVRGSQPQCWVVVDPSGDCGEQSFTVGPGFDEDEREDAEHFARMTSTALERLASRAYSEPTVKSCLTEYAHALTKADVPGSIPSERHRAGIEAVLAHCLNRAPDAEYLRKYAEAVLASRAPSIDEVVDALLRVQPFRDGHETGPTGLVRRADVEQVMRALFDRRVT